MGRFYGDLPDRTFDFARAILGLVDQFPNTPKAWVIQKQIIRCGTSVGANIHEADHAFTEADFAHKCSVSRKEASETHYWLRLCRETGLLNGPAVDAALKEADELVRVLATVIKKVQVPVPDVKIV